MQTYLKSGMFVLGLMGCVLTYEATAHPRGPVLFDFTLTVEQVDEPKIYLGHESIAPTGKNTFKLNTRQADYYFKVQYQHAGKTQEAVCPISGAPKFVTAIIDPTKTGREACTTRESGREKKMVAL